jgi:Fur family peroxide stress response transcriptional regulator
MERCRAAGLKVTPQRLAIYEALAKRADHPSPEEVWNAVRPQMPTLSLATVYKTLDALAQAGLVAQVAHRGDTKRFDANVEPHHHLICRACSRIADFVDARLDILPDVGALGFSADEVKAQIFGVCGDCAEA